MASPIQLVSSNKSFSGVQNRYLHHSELLKCDMHFSVYLPPQAAIEKVPLLWWLSGLTCTDENFVIKAGAQQFAAKHGVAILCPDTSPRGSHVPSDPDGGWDFGHGAGFYVDATQEPWKENYQMYSYVTQELPVLVSSLNVDLERISIFGHSMGGHGALTIALKDPARFQSVSALAPIVSPTISGFGQKAFRYFLGSDKAVWKNYDTCELLSDLPTSAKRLPMLIDQGEEDEFLAEYLKTEQLVEASKLAEYPMQIRYQPGYDHSYFFVASFVEEHIRFHANYLHS